MIAAGLLCVALLLHGATAWRYGYFRDELYFIACSKHLAWGYVDQPPLVAVAAWLSAPAGYQLLALRALPVLAAAGTVYLSAMLAKELGGGRFAQFLAGLATLFLPAYLLLGSTLTTTSFEPFFWTATIYLTVRILRAPAADAAVPLVRAGDHGRAGCLRQIFDGAARASPRSAGCSSPGGATSCSRSTRWAPSRWRR